MPWVAIGTISGVVTGIALLSLFFVRLMILNASQALTIEMLKMQASFLERFGKIELEVASLAQDLQRYRYDIVESVHDHEKRIIALEQS